MVITAARHRRIRKIGCIWCPSSLQPFRALEMEIWRNSVASDVATLQKINIDPGSHRGWKISFLYKTVIFRVYVYLLEDIGGFMMWKPITVPSGYFNLIIAMVKMAHW